MEEKGERNMMMEFQLPSKERSSSVATGLSRGCQANKIEQLAKHNPATAEPNEPGRPRRNSKFMFDGEERFKRDSRQA
jgi:hypothetical protein